MQVTGKGSRSYMFLKDELIFNLIQAKQQPWKWSYRQKSFLQHDIVS